MAASPPWLPRRHRDKWARPWTRAARKSRDFHVLLWKHGYVSPHFTKREWACHDGTPVPDRLRRNAQRHAFNLEVIRHEPGVAPLPILSAYRPAAYNRKVGGAKNSRHIHGDATDVDVGAITRIGQARFFQLAERVFYNGGVGRYPSGSAHLDSRGWRARWTSF